MADGPVKDWSITIEIPWAVLLPGTIYAHERRSEGTATRARFRFTPEDSPNGETLYPEVTETRSISYQMTSELFWHGQMENESIVAKAYMNDELVGESRLPHDGWQFF